MFPVFSRDYGRANAEIGRLVAERPDRLVGFGAVHAARDAGRIPALVGEAVSRWGLRGLRVHRREASLTREVCEAARRWRLPVFYDVAGQAALLEMTVPRYPDVTFIVPHLGSFADDWRAHVMVVDQLARHPNLYADTSGVRRFDYLLQAVQRAGAHKLVFGSDGPWLHPALELTKVRLLGLPPEEESLVLGGTLGRLLKEAA